MATYSGRLAVARSFIRQWQRQHSSAKLLSWCVVYLGYLVPLPWCTKVAYGVRYAVSILVIQENWLRRRLATNPLLYFGHNFETFWWPNARRKHYFPWHLFWMLNKRRIEFAVNAVWGNSTKTAFALASCMISCWRCLSFDTQGTTSSFQIPNSTRFVNITIGDNANASDLARMTIMYFGQVTTSKADGYLDSCRLRTRLFLHLQQAQNCSMTGGWLNTFWNNLSLLFFCLAEIADFFFTCNLRSQKLALCVWSCCINKSWHKSPADESRTVHPLRANSHNKTTPLHPFENFGHCFAPVSNPGSEPAHA